MNVLIVLTSHDQLGDTGKKTGFWLEEFAAPYYHLKDAGVQVTWPHRVVVNRRLTQKVTNPIFKLMQRDGLTMT